MGAPPTVIGSEHVSTKSIQSRRGRRASRALTAALLAGLTFSIAEVPTTSSAAIAPDTARAAVATHAGEAAAPLAPATFRKNKKRAFGPLRTGVSTGFSTVYAPADRQNKDLAMAKQMGVGQIRVDISWALIQPEPDIINWGLTDALINATRRNKLNVLGVVGFAPPWGQNSDGSVKPELFADFVDAAAQRYGPKVAAWEIWNEPNQQHRWNAKPNPAAYARLVEAASAPIRRRDPKAKILMGSLAPAVNDPNGVEISPITFLQGVYRAGIDRSAYDVVSIHPFSYPALPSGDEEWNTFNRLPDIHQVAISNGDGRKPFWLTEYGARTGNTSNSVSFARQKRLILDAYRETKKLKFVQALFFYSLRDASSNRAEPEDNFGVLTYDGTPKPVYAALRRALTKR